jgi:hypothetical protein
MTAHARLRSVDHVMPTFLIESYAPQPDADPLAAALDHCENHLARHRWSLLLPEEEICFHVVDGESVAAVREMAQRAGVRCDRITAAVVVSTRYLEPDGGPSAVS